MKRSVSRRIINRVLISFSLLALSGCSWSLVPQTAESLPVAGPVSELPTRVLTVGDTELTVEVAATDAARTQGLSGRASLLEDQGMLFVFNEPDRPTFWMNRMNFALDFLWLNSGMVVEVTAHVPPPTPLSPIPVTLSPQQAVDAVIEVPAGWVERHQVVVGTQVRGLTSLEP